MYIFFQQPQKINSKEMNVAIFSFFQMRISKTRRLISIAIVLVRSNL